MESTARSTASAAGTSLQSLAIPEEGNKLTQQIPASSRAPPSAFKKKEPEFKCMHCPRTFKTARARGGHVKAHKHLHHRLARAGPETAPAEFKCMHCSRTFKTAQARGWHVKATGGLAPAQPSSAANGYLGTVGGGHLASLHREVNQGETAHRIHYFPSLRSSAGPLFLSQTGSGTSSLPQPLFAAPALVAEGNGGTGDGVHLGGQQDMPAVNQEETADGIDLTLRL
ncbi:unnamed protein product [Alopecurus aequalis]